MRAFGSGEHTPRWLRPAGVVLIVLLLVVVVRQREQRPIISSLDIQPAATPRRPAETGSGDRQPAATTAHLRIYTGAGSYDKTVAASLAPPLEEALAYAEQRTGLALARPINVVFDRRPQACGLDAAAYTATRTIMLYACSDTPTRRAVNILAHEYVHQLAHDRYGEQHLEADLILSEGFATWGAGRYWLGSYRSFHDFVQAEYGAHLLPLATDPRAGVPIATLNQLYYQWASFVEWVRATHGQAAFDQLYVTGATRRPGSAGYQAVLQTGLADAEQQWHAWLQQPFTPAP